jgi:hypothetical protein
VKLPEYFLQQDSALMQSYTSMLCYTKCGEVYPYENKTSRGDDKDQSFSNIIAFGHRENHLQEIMLKKHFSDISLFLGK